MQVSCGVNSLLTVTIKLPFFHQLLFLNKLQLVWALKDVTDAVLALSSDFSVLSVDSQRCGSAWGGGEREAPAATGMNYIQDHRRRTRPAGSIRQNLFMQS